MNRFTPIGLLLLLACGALTGCVSARYKSAAKDVPPPVPLALKASGAPLEIALHTVIVYHGPGSWKRDAYWDEYVVSLANQGAEDFIVESATLTDFHGAESAPGVQPWPLEKLSKERHAEWRKGDSGALVHIGAGLAVTTVAGVAGVVTLGGATAAAGTWAAGMVGAAALPVYIGTAIYRNVSSRHDIEREFAKRRVVLPQTLAPGQTAEGSLFFPISPGPQSLVVHGRTRSGERQTLRLTLEPLARLHLEAAPGGRSAL